MGNPDEKVTIIGGGIIGALEAYFTFLEAKKAGKQVRVTIHEKNSHVLDTTCTNIVPSLTPDEILSVVPRGTALVEKLAIPFSEPGGIRVDDVENVNDTDIASKFVSEVQVYSYDEAGHKKRTQALLKLGKRSMDLWQHIYDEGDAKLQRIMREANFKPCREPKSEGQKLHDGYRIDLIYNVANAQRRAEGMQADYASLGYEHCKILTPDEVQAMDPALSHFCAVHSITNLNEQRVWKSETTALFRPGGCIDTAVFLPKFYIYLQRVMGKYVNEQGIEKHCFRLRLQHELGAVDFANKDALEICGLRFTDQSRKTNKHQYQNSQYIFCPGSAVGTLSKLGFAEPAYAGFAGASLRLYIPLTSDQAAEFADFNHCMEVHQEGVVLAWQARCIGNQIFIGVAGTKAFYADQTPTTAHDFAINRNVLQLNMINQVLPQFISMAFGKDRRGETLTAVDLAELVVKGIAKRWVGTRAVAYDGFPTLGSLYWSAPHTDKRKISNARTTTHLGSGGSAFGPAAVLFSRYAPKPDPAEPLATEIAEYSRSDRRAALAV